MLEVKEQKEEWYKEQMVSMRQRRKITGRTRFLSEERKKEKKKVQRNERKKNGKGL